MSLIKNSCFFIVLVLVLAACSKTKYNNIPNAAYLRVFNSLDFEPNVPNKDLPTPFLTMIVDPEFDKSGMVTGGKIVGDFLDKRIPYAAPYPANAGSSDYRNVEYPGTENVPVGPILNGINLSSWAQVPSGKHRILFFSRPITPTPFFNLDPQFRQTMLVDSTVDLGPGEVYTMEVLQKTIASVLPTPIQLYMRQEQFTQRPFNDTVLYVNFYNLSAEGYAAAHPELLDQGYYFQGTNRTTAFGDTMNLFYSLFSRDMPYPLNELNTVGSDLVPGYNNIWLGTLVRSQSSGLAPYYPIPMFAAPDTTGGILSMEWQQFILMAPGLSPAAGPVPIDYNLGMAGANPLCGAIGCTNLANDGKYDPVVSPPRTPGFQNVASTFLPNLIRYTASGTYPQRSFATISSIEIINGYVYLTSVQRTYPPPVH